jgi:putative flippase GtrA
MKLYRFFIDNRLSILSFLTVGAIAAVINFASFVLFWNFIQLNYQIAVSFSFILSVIFHFTANRHFTFKNNTTKCHRQLPRYLIMVFINYFTTLIVICSVVEFLHGSPYLGNLIAIGVTVNIGYIMSRFWVFVTTTE